MQVVIVSSPTCAPCKTLKENLKKEGIDFEEYDIEMVPMQFARDVSGLTSVPITLIYSEEGLKKKFVGYSSNIYKGIMQSIMEEALI